MKLIDLLVKELPKRGGWPEGCDVVSTNGYGAVWAYKTKGFTSGRELYFHSATEGHVTRAQYEAALAKNDGWIDWGGGECPVKSDSIVDVRFRSGDEKKERPSVVWDWGRDDCHSDIIAYRLHRYINSRANDDRLEQDLNECIGQEVDMTEWSGDGLPPVGCECEVKSGDTFADYDWVKIKVVYSHMGELIGIVDMPGESIHNDMEKLSAGYCGAIFRPLRTEAEKLREKAIDELVSVICGDVHDTGMATAEMYAERVYDAGYRKEVK